MNLEGILQQTLNQGTISQMSQTLGTDEATTGSAVQVALPMLLGAMARNSQTPEGASSLLGALDRDHDGSVLDDVAGLFGGGGQNSATNGLGILGHVFGGQLGAVQSGVSQTTGMDPARAGQLLVMLAPVVMGALGRANRQGQLDGQSLPALLGGAAQQSAGSSGAAGLLSQLLDSNQDGSAVDDVMRLASNFFNRPR